LKKILKYQFWHLLFLSALVLIAYQIIKIDPSFLKGELFGIYALTWLSLAIASSILHQIYVVICWRFELHFKSISKIFGDKSFTIFKIGFLLLILSRPVTILLLAFANAGTLNIGSTFSYLIAAVLLVPVVYLFYSLKKYFGIDRAVGIDHFYPQKFKNTTIVKEGIFKYSSNAMYVFGFGLFYIIAILFKSKGALLAALFHHIYIWIHYYFTELPDMKVIYKK